VDTQKTCPFGIEARFCEHQETRAKDLVSAIQGDVVFFCLLDDVIKCPKMREILDGGSAITSRRPKWNF